MAAFTSLALTQRRLRTFTSAAVTCILCTGCWVPFASGLLNLNVKPPVFQIVQWMEADDYQWKVYGEANAGLSYNSTTYFIPGEIYGIMLECNASYPVEILFEMDEVFDTVNFMMVYSILTKARREAKSVADQSSYQYSMKYMLYSTSNQNTGRYVCHSTQNPDVKTGIYIMWEGNAPPYLLGADADTGNGNKATAKPITIRSAGKKFVILPCKVSSPTPDAEVSLEKNINVTKENNETAMEFVSLSTNESITYDTTYGFSLNVAQMGNVDGLYRCSTVELDDELYLNVTSENPKPAERSAVTTWGRQAATLSYEAVENSLVCCSNSAHPPTLIFAFCPNPTVCKMIRNMLTQNFEVFSKFSYGGSNTVKNCTKQSLHGYSGLAVCKGDGIDTTVEVFFPVELTENGTRLEKIYKKWSDANPEDLVHVHAINITWESYEDPYGETYRYRREEPWTSQTKMFTGQNVSFCCDTSSYYFASGIKWKIEWRNKTVEWPEFSDIANLDHYMYYWMPPNALTLDVHKDMAAVTCYAPVWNSTDWVEKNFSLEVKDPVEPIVTSSSPDLIYWTLNDTDKELDCTTTAGEPTPRMVWLKDGKELVSDQNQHFTFKPSDPGTLVLEFKLVSYDTHGVYTCVSSNLAGEVEKSFTVIVEEPHPWTAIIIVVAISVGLVLGIGFLAWRIWKQRNMASALQRSNEFQRSRDLD